jgi:DNA excision repair protein ERCC-4
MTSQSGPEPLTTPFAILIDQREKLPFGFDGLTADYRDNYRPLWVPTQGVTLDCGDYSVHGLVGRVAVERKSLTDLFSTIGQGRDRFERELERLQRLEYAAVVVEADWHTVLANPPPHTTLSPKIVFRSIVAWQQRYCRVHWWLMPNRRLAEVTTFRILERFWRENGNA